MNVGEMLKEIGTTEKEHDCSKEVTASECRCACERGLEDEKLKKANKVDRLKTLCKNGKRIGFIVVTPGTSSGRFVHSVSMIGGQVKKTKDDNYIITGIDLELSLTAEIIEKANLKKRTVLTEDFESKEFRSYRIDRILDGTIMWNS